MSEVVVEQKENDWRKARERRQLNTSASQHETFLLCPRKWWLSKVRKLEDATTRSQVFGTVVHGVIERFLLADDLGRGPDGQPVDLYPPNWQEAKGRFGEPSEGRIDPMQEADVKRLIQAAIDNGVLERLPGRRVELNFNRNVLRTPCPKCEGKKETWTGKKCPHCNGCGQQVDNSGEERSCGGCGGTGDEFGKCDLCGGDGHGCTVQMVGFIDVAFRDQIQDHKTTKSMKYAKSPNKLAQNTQMLIYAHEILEQAKDRGEPIPQTVTLRHNVYCAAENKVRKTECVVTREAIEQAWEVVTRNSVKMAELRTLVNAWHEIHDPENPSQACNAYGGCAFRSVCSGQESEDSFEKRVARQKELLYSSESKVAMQGALQANQSQPVIKGTTTVANFNDRVAQMKARNAAGGLPPAGAPPPSTAAVNPPPVTTPAAAPAQHTAIQMPQGMIHPPQQAQPPVTTAAPAVAPTTTAAPAVAPTTTAAPAVTGSNLPPVTPMEVAGVGVVAPPPWAMPGCNGCNGVGFSGKGTPCRICDMKSKMAGKPVSGSYFIETLENGIVMWADRTNEALVGYSFITGRPAEAVKGQAREATAPTNPPPTPAPVVEAAPAHVGAPKDETKASVQAPVAIITAPAIPPGASPLPPEALSPEQNAQAEGKRKRRTRAEMEAATKPASTNSTEVSASVVEFGMILVIGAIATKCPFDNVDFQEVFNSYAAELAKSQSAASYYDLDPFKRRDALAQAAPKIAEDIGNMFVFADPQTPDTKALLEALRPYASMVVVGTK